MIFSHGYQVTQTFGNNPSYYGQWGLAGHEGLDVVPNDSDWNVHAVEPGIVVRVYPATVDNYGLHVVIWNPLTSHGFWYCHLQSIAVQLNQQIQADQIIGVMGATGNATGPHLHLGLRLTDPNGYAINMNNGFKGFVDPAPYLKVTPPPPPPPPQNQSKSKLGVYVTATNALDPTHESLDAYMGRLKPRLVVSMDHNVGKWQAVRAASPNTFIVGRVFRDPEPDYRPDPEGAAQKIFNDLLPVMNQMRGLYDAWMATNEPVVSSANDAALLSRFYAKWGDLMKGAGFKSVAYSFSTGVPEIAYWQNLAEGLRHCDYLGVHEYSAPTMDASQTWECLRYRQGYNALPADARKPVIVAECGIDGGPIGQPGWGWQHYGDEAHYLTSLQWYDGELKKDDYVLGGAIFVLAGFGNNGSFSIVGAHQIENYIAAGGDPGPVQPPAPVKPTQDQVLKIIADTAKANGIDPVAFLGGAIAESNLDPWAARYGTWPDVSFGLFQQTVKWAVEGDHSNSDANVNYIKSLYFDPQHAANVAIIQFKGYLNAAGNALDAWCLYNAPAIPPAQNPNRGNYQNGLARAAQMIQPTPPPPPPPTPANQRSDKPSDAHLASFPRPANDTGRGLHFVTDATVQDVNHYAPFLQQMKMTWTVAYNHDELQVTAAAQALQKYGIMSVLRVEARQENGRPGYGPKTPDFFANLVKLAISMGLPPYVQIFNEPELTDEWVDMEAWANNWGARALAVAQAGGYAGLQCLSEKYFARVAQNMDPRIRERLFFVSHNYGDNKPPDYPYNKGQTAIQDPVCVLQVLANLAWMDKYLGQRVPIICGEGGWEWGASRDAEYPKLSAQQWADYHYQLFDSMRTGKLPNGDDLPDEIFCFTSWITAPGGFWQGDAWLDGVDAAQKKPLLDRLTADAPYTRQFGAPTNPNPPPPPPVENSQIALNLHFEHVQAAYLDGAGLTGPDTPIPLDTLPHTLKLVKSDGSTFSFKVALD